MRKLSRRLAVMALLAAGMVPATAQAQPPQPMPVADADAKIEVQARGPVHEAFAQAWSPEPARSKIIKQKPPAPIPEEPPDQKPAGENINWIPGYWQWDDEKTDFIWVTGTWRKFPEGRRWVVGHWAKADDGYYWVSGRWAAEVERDFQFVEQPPAPRDERQPPAAPDANSVWIPGTWQLTENGYQWREGYWTDAREGMVWQPARYYSSPNGYLYSSGYWDYDLNSRGLLYAPVYFNQPLWNNAGWSYRPRFAVNPVNLLTSLFVRPLLGQYAFGNYFGGNYAGLGYQPWFNYGATRFDPLYSYSNWAYRNDPTFFSSLRTTYDGRINGTLPAPPLTLAAMNRAGVNPALSTVLGMDQLRTSNRMRFDTVTPAQRDNYRQAVQNYRQSTIDLNRARMNLDGNTGASFGPNGFRLNQGQNMRAQPGINIPGTNLQLPIDGRGRGQPGVNIPGNLRPQGDDGRGRAFPPPPQQQGPNPNAGSRPPAAPAPPAPPPQQGGNPNRGGGKKIK